MTKKVAIIGTAGIPAKYGGFESLAAYLTKHLGTAFDMTVYCSSQLYPTKLKTYNHARLKYLPIQANGVQSIVYDIVSIFSALRFANTLLILGVSGCVVLPVVKLISNKTIIVNIDGLEWKRAKWGKAAKWFLKFSEKLAVKYADVVISDNRVIQDYVLNTYQVSSELIAYGADHSHKVDLSQDVLSEYPYLTQPYAFKVCRIEPENNVSLILEAFSEYPELNIVIVGNWDNSNYGKTLKTRFEGFKHIKLLNPIYDQAILDQFRSNCMVYVHGHSAGGTNPSLVEAMYLELPILAYGVAYNKETTNNKAAYFSTKADLIALLKHTSNESLDVMSKHLKQVADSEYKWDIISRKYASLFNR